MGLSNLSKKILFFRDFSSISGGHIKAWDYFNHALSYGLDAKIKFTPNSFFNDSNPWRNLKETWVSETIHCKPSLLFVAGYDWIQAEEYPNIPVINLIQGFRHLDPQEKLNGYLSRYAWRICVSPELYESVSQYPATNGPVFCIPNCIDLKEFEKAKDRDQRSIDFLIYGIKKPLIARKLETYLRSKTSANIFLINESIPQKQFFDALKNTKTAIMLPVEKEGFFLPALEAMAAGALLICPDCVGNRSFCENELNCLIPDYTFDGIKNSLERAFGMGSEEIKALIERGSAVAQKHSLESERRQFFKILDDIQNNSQK